MRVVSNSTPLIALSRIGKLDILRVVFGTIAIPEAVFNEVVKKGASRPGANEVRDAAWISVKQVKSKRQTLPTWTYAWAGRIIPLENG